MRARKDRMAMVMPAMVPGLIWCRGCRVPVLVTGSVELVSEVELTEGMAMMFWEFVRVKMA